MSLDERVWERVELARYRFLDTLKVGCCHHCNNLVKLCGRSGVHGVDPRPCEGTPHHHRIDQSGKLQIGHELRIPPEQAIVLHPGERLSQLFHAGHSSCSRRSITAATMLWYPVQRHRLPESL